MKRRPPRSTRHDTLFPYTTLCRYLVSGLIRMPKGVPPMTTTGKLSKLTLSPINVRRRPDDLLEIPQMAADLEARGVLQNLLVTPVKKPRGTFEVFDGGRRLRGLLLLAEIGRAHV